jgi:hypothetical protein
MQEAEMGTMHLEHEELGKIHGLQQNFYLAKD